VTSPRAVLDLRPYACPLTYVKTRIALERLADGERLELWLTAGEPVESVPRSAEEEGHRVLSVEPLGPDGAEYRVIVEKRAASAEALP
jgi:TusA-related sulfurtransferase